MLNKHLCKTVLMATLVLLTFGLTFFPSLATRTTPDIVTVQDDIISDTTWTKDHVYVVENDVTVVRGVKLAIEAGTVVKFAQYADLIVEGCLQVNTAPTFLYLPVLFKAHSSSVALFPPSPKVMTQPTIPVSPNRVYFTSLRDDAVGGDTNGDEDASTPQRGDWGGIVFAQSSEDYFCFMREFAIRYSGEPRQGQQVGAILLENASPYLADGEFVGNYLEGIEIQRSNWLNDVWDTRGIAYHVTGDVTILRANTLGIAPDVVVKFAEAKRLIVKGTLQAVGSAGHPIILTSIVDDTALGDTNGDGEATSPAKKDWGGVLFEEECRANPGTLAFTELRYTGKAIMPSVAAIELDNCSPNLHDITFVENHLNGAQLVAGRHELETLTLDSPNVPYCILDDLEVKRGETLTVKPGVTLKFERNRSLHVLGILNAVGTREQPVVMTSLRDDSALNDTNGDAARTIPERGDWGCVFFADQSDDSLNVMDWVEMRYGGRDGLEFSTMIGAVRLDNASPTLTHIIFEDNWINAVEIPKGDWRSDTWDNVDVVYFVSGDLRIPQGETLSVAPGVIVKVANRISPTDPPGIRVEGALRVGDLASPPPLGGLLSPSAISTARVVFTSGRDDAIGPVNATNWDSNGDGTETAPEIHDWIGIIFAPTADVRNSHFRDTVFKYGGTKAGTFHDPHGVLRFEGTDTPGVLSPAIEYCQFTENYRGVEALEGALPLISMSIFEDNEDYAVYNGTPMTTTVQAINNWWDAANGPRSDGEPCNTAPGDGAMISCGVAYEPWLASRP